MTTNRIKYDKGAAVYLGLTVAQVARLRKARKLPYCWKGGRVVYFSQQLDRWKALSPGQKELKRYPFPKYLKY